MKEEKRAGLHEWKPAENKQQDTSTDRHNSNFNNLANEKIKPVPNYDEESSFIRGGK